MASTPQILFIDAFDSFSNNIISLLETECSVSAVKVTIKSDPAHVAEVIKHVDAVVIGPGPGVATIPEDIGNISDVWSLCEQYNLPVLGVCLGFQTLVSRYGGLSPRLPFPRHGIQTKITSCGKGIFAGLPELTSIQYHSNRGFIHHKVEQDGFDGNINTRELWLPSDTCPDLVPLAWDFDRRTEEEAASDLESDTRRKRNPDAILMAVKHSTYPFFGVQFHPESVCSSADARQVVVNWWNLAKHHTRNNETAPTRNILPLRPNGASQSSYSHGDAATKTLLYETLKGNLRVTSIIDSLKLNPEQGHEIVLLDSEKCLRPELGVHSVIGVVTPQTLRLEYRVGTGFIKLVRGDKVEKHSIDSTPSSVFTYLKRFMNERRVDSAVGPQRSPFWGGLVGYIDYEAGLETLHIPVPAPKPGSESAPNISFAFIERSVVLNHTDGTIFVQSTDAQDRKWVSDTKILLSDLNAKIGANDLSRTASSSSSEQSDVEDHTPPSDHPAELSKRDRPVVTIQRPKQPGYHNKIEQCQQFIGNGDSYELCLTDQTTINVRTRYPQSEWDLYKRLRGTNPAPFGAYIKLGSLKILSSSPERFLSWSRPESLQTRPATNSKAAKGSVCQFRPIKGTVKKYSVDESGKTTFVNRDTAARLLSTAKEQAENLMIADLIRHDLSGVIGSRNVYTKDLMRIEEYESVYQLVTVIEGQVETQAQQGKPREDCVSGVDVLGASLPPGSMTGAPKKRSCELLRSIEGGKDRSIYSGVIGYLDVGGGGDFAVVIRTAFSLLDSQTKSTSESYEQNWRIGAGGAITSLSTLEGEFEEMNVKLDSVLRAFN